MTHIVLTQIKEEVKTPILVNYSDICYSNPANDNYEDQYINLNTSDGLVSIRVTETALEIAALITATFDFED